ncbi:helix-turn-helix domain-containing protein [Hyalangium versicolor]|uniref:helix-turn-helix domain-containing protein n=1 Tax=Hyalangium versicolor TaxID=2861190 RepID=UPI0028155EB5|nr:helix-turn-helix domain-containing protein [Hyalangium versicolor]
MPWSRDGVRGDRRYLNLLTDYQLLFPAHGWISTDSARRLPFFARRISYMSQCKPITFDVGRKCASGEGTPGAAGKPAESHWCLSCSGFPTTSSSSGPCSLRVRVCAQGEGMDRALALFLEKVTATPSKHLRSSHAPLEAAGGAFHAGALAAGQRVKLMPEALERLGSTRGRATSVSCATWCAEPCGCGRGLESTTGTLPFIEKALRRCRNNEDRAARELGLARSSLLGLALLGGGGNRTRMMAAWSTWRPSGHCQTRHADRGLPQGQMPQSDAQLL